MRSMIKRGMVLASAVVLLGMSQAQAATATVEYLYSLSSVGLENGMAYTGQGNDISVQINQQAIAFDVNSQNATTFQAAGFTGTTVQGMSDTERVGLAFNLGNTSALTYVPKPSIWMLTFHQDAHAYLWNETGASDVDLHPAGYYSSYALATDGVHQVGMATYSPDTFLKMHAMLWSGTSNSAVDLNPANATLSQAEAVSGNFQGGSAFIDSQYHAYLWQGSAESGIDLHPQGYTESFVTTIVGDQQFGYGVKEGLGQHPLMWSGTAESVVDLSPSNDIGYQGLYVTDASDSGIQIGFAALNSGTHAVAWQGSAESFIDLSTLLDNSQSNYAVPLSIEGNVIYGRAFDSGPDHNGLWMVKWTITPEPGTLGLLGIGALGLMRRRRLA